MRNQSAGQLKQDIVFSSKLLGRDFTFHSTWGLFSPKKIDEGSHFLMTKVELAETDSVLDMGCGYGAIGIALSAKVPQGSVTMIDSNYKAVEYAEKNVEINHIANARTQVSFGLEKISTDEKFDVIVSNLPANVGREMLYILLSDARDHLKVGGHMYVVTVAGLRQYIHTNFEKVFGNHFKVGQERGYSVASAKRLK